MHLYNASKLHDSISVYHHIQLAFNIFLVFIFNKAPISLTHWCQVQLSSFNGDNGVVSIYYYNTSSMSSPVSWVSLKLWTNPMLMKLAFVRSLVHTQWIRLDHQQKRIPDDSIRNASTFYINSECSKDVWWVEYWIAVHEATVTLLPHK